MTGDRLHEFLTQIERHNAAAVQAFNPIELSIMKFGLDAPRNDEEIHQAALSTVRRLRLLATHIERVDRYLQNDKGKK